MLKYQVLFGALLISSSAFGEIRDGKQLKAGPVQIQAETISCWQSGKQIVGPLKLATIRLSSPLPNSSAHRTNDNLIIEGISEGQTRVRIIVSHDTTCQLTEG
jgi:hypothetical protein